MLIVDNKLAELDIRSCVNLKGFVCFNNNLTNLDLSQNLELEGLGIRDNNFPEQNLNFLSHLVNLKRLSLGNGSREYNEINQGIYNRFKGSLEPLQNLIKLEKLHIEDTDIDSGLEYLAESVKEFRCSANYRKDAKVKVLENILETCN